MIQNYYILQHQDPLIINTLFQKFATTKLKITENPYTNSLSNIPNDRSNE